MSDSKSTEQDIDEVFEDLIVGHNFDYAANKIKSIIGRGRLEAVVAELQREQRQNYEAKRSRRISELQDVLTLGSDYEAQGHIFDYRKAFESHE